MFSSVFQIIEVAPEPVNQSRRLGGSEIAGLDWFSYQLKKGLDEPKSGGLKYPSRHPSRYTDTITIRNQGSQFVKERLTAMKARSSRIFQSG
ncbi:hypothetical protein GUITHDRAFT_102113 [Guillardia theta CCMP2712]|uniref:Uncharacterized protein n=1 Tax=Guillardia theta (strain CCMP2712) TaxID=905079 RepID=L1JVH9_GUITC|nr:hypothetical protein GUITHDRAFT_102113 [Guillardia theta CCMP2712]EKX52210.1 hypothetical protein GUITHDRAFT_102113 [Guillardia theta CCMP2712]|eukprot:XP_005839190.1 hypothetical protein GUITHDRAFT_102113 [Guillardia theta CCMP2712]